MFEHLKDHKKIFVVGIARSGTRIAAKMIAHDTGKTYIDETEWGIHDLKKLVYLDKYRNNFVVQANSAYHIMPVFSREKTLFVFVKRPIDEIKASWDRIRNLQSTSPISRESTLSPQQILPPEEKLVLWESKKAKLRNLIEIEYSSLSTHPLWINKKDREQFRWNQTRPSQFSKIETAVLS